jgi:hypothetical protein
MGFAKKAVSAVSKLRKKRKTKPKMSHSAKAIQERQRQERGIGIVRRGAAKMLGIDPFTGKEK